MYNFKARILRCAALVGTLLLAYTSDESHLQKKDLGQPIFFKMTDQVPSNLKLYANISFLTK